MTGLGSSLAGLRLPQSMASLGGAPVQGGEVDDGTFIVTFDNPDASEYILTFDDLDGNEYILTMEAA